jgi:hypothetical protein
MFLGLLFWFKKENKTRKIDLHPYFWIDAKKEQPAYRRFSRAYFPGISLGSRISFKNKRLYPEQTGGPILYCCRFKSFFIAVQFQKRMGSNRPGNYSGYICCYDTGFLI